jgi:enterochelin esterase-like enzyme
MYPREISVYTFISRLALSLLMMAAAPMSLLGQQPPPVQSPELHSDRRVTFRVFAPRAQSVRLNGSDIPGNGAGTEMTRSENGIWQVTLGPLAPGAYRYTFLLDGVSAVDPRNPSVSESNSNVWSLVTVPGSEWMDIRNVPHGTLSRVTYYSTVLSRFRRMHVYTPPGYEKGTGRFPVFYLLHGAGDSDDSWSSVGRAGVILDNLIAAGKAKPMIVVMPAGHTRPFSFGAPPRSGSQSFIDEFQQEFMRDIIPAIEKNYRIIANRNGRAIAGLSMGGAQTLNIFLSNPEKFAYVGVFSSGLFNAFPRQRPGETSPPDPNARSPWEEQNLALLQNPVGKQGMKLFWFGTGKEDFLLQISRSTVNLLKKYGFNVVYEETDGAHTWLVWRDYLIQFTPQLFR